LGLGRDHWPICWSIALGGGGIRTGQVVGKSDERGAYAVDRQVCVNDVVATVYKALGIQWDKEYITPVGRPIKIANSLNDTTGEPDQGGGVASFSEAGAPPRTDLLVPSAFRCYA